MEMTAGKAKPPAPLAVSMGEPGGIGPDIILEAVKGGPDGETAPDFLVFGDPVTLSERAIQLGLDVSIVGPSAGRPVGANLPVEPTSTSEGFVAGVLTKDSAKAALASLSAATRAVAEGRCSGLVTAPINKSNLYEIGFEFPGHTEFLEHFTRTELAEPQARSVMMLAGPRLRAVPVTIHVPLAQVPSLLRSQDIIDICRITAADLQRRFGIENPRLAVAGLNPHAGENGSIGSEEKELIEPAIKRLRLDGIQIDGPFPADTLFHEEARGRYDVAVCTYHDQALIPAKALDFHDTVNVTLGLPFVRTSPDHGTALELAGTGYASPRSFVAALRMAATMVQG
ncbi:MAG: 4-hydroxythreonine-4-phosphate dehydrogenase PdxA [Pseudomonadota bacterium]